MTETESADETVEPATFEITVEKTIEVDFTNEEMQTILQMQETENINLALEMMYGQRALETINPEEKLLGIEVTANGPSDD